MRKQPLTFICFFFASVLITSTVLVVATSQLENNVRNLSIPETLDINCYDPWSDLNDDGKIDIFDVVMVASKYGCSGDPIAKASLNYTGDWENITDKAGEYITITHNLNSTNIMVNIEGRTTQNGGIHQRYLGLTYCAPGWSKAYGGSNNDNAMFVIQTSDGGYAIVGQTNSFGAGNIDFWLVKTDWAGNLEWNKTYGGSQDDEAYSVVQTDDGGFAIAGLTYSFGAGGRDFWLVKTDWNGNEQWNRTYGGANDDRAFTLTKTIDGGYAMAGYTESYSVGQRDFWLVKTNSSGHMEWNKVYGETGDETAFSIVQTDDTGYVLGGQTNSYGAGSYDFWLVKTNSTGDSQWNGTYGGSGNDWGRDVIQTDDGGYAIAGNTASFGAGANDIWLVKTDMYGNMAWNKTYGGANHEGFGGLIHTNDLGYALAGWTASFGAGQNDFWLVKTDANGITQWNKTHGGLGTEEPNHVIQTSDGGYVIAGWTQTYGAGGSDFWLVKTEVEQGLAWTDSTADTITLYRGSTDGYWNYVRVSIWKPKDP